MKRTSAVAAGAAALALGLTACSSSAPEPASDGAAEAVSLTFWHGYTEADGDVLEKIVDDFNASHENISITTSVNPWAVIDDTLLPALSADNGPQIVAMPAERLPVYAAKGAFVSLDDFYAGSEATDAVNPGALEMVTVDGTAYGVPTGFVPLAMFYNKALFAAAGIAEVPTDWDSWVTAAQALTKDENGDGTPEQYGLALPDHQTVANGVWPSLLYGNGGDIVADGEAVIDSPENAETLAFWHDAIAAGKISPTGVDGISGDALFSSGRVGMYLGGPWMSSIAQENNIDYGIAAVPAGPQEQAASAIGVSMALTEGADDAQRAAAKEFFDYFLAHDQSVAWSLGSGWPPLRTDVDGAEVAENAVVAALTEQAEFGRPLLPGVINSTDVLTAVDTLTQKAMAGEAIDDLLAAAQVEIQSALDDQ